MMTTEHMKPHTDGGTYEVIATADTRNGWSIAITRWITYRGVVKFEVYRMAPDGAAVRLHLASDEGQARKLANIEWKKDR